MFTRTQNSASLICLLSTVEKVPKIFDALSDFHRFKVSPYLQILLFGIKKYGTVVFHLKSTHEIAKKQC